MGRSLGRGRRIAPLVVAAAISAWPPGALAAERDGKVRVRFSDPPKAGLLVDLEGRNEVLWERKAGRRRPVASLTKMMTAIAALEELKPREKVRISQRAEDTPPVEIGLEAGTRVRAETLLAAMLIPSANDAATALAEGAAGSERRFVRRMNEEARDRDLGCTRFASPHGIEDGNRSCPDDLVQIAEKVLQERRTAKLARDSRRKERIPGRGRVVLNTTNPLLQSGYRGTVGVKTGFTRSAGRCLVAAVERDGRTLVAVLLNSPDTGGQARKLFDKALRRR